MSLRLIRKSSTQNPESDELLIPWIMGAEGEGDPADDDDSEDSDDEDDEDDPETDVKSKSKDEAQELDKLKRRMKAADRRAAEAERKAREYEDKDKSELEVTTRRVAELETENTALQGELLTLRRERQFLGSNTVTWHDPEIALAKLNWDDIVDEDGEADQAKLSKAIEALAKAKPFLVKKANEDDDDESPRQQQSSGSRVGSGRKQTKKELDREALLKRFPALR